MSMAERSKYLHQNSVTGVKMFQPRIQSFFAQYLLSDAHPLGEITDQVTKIEFQMRESLNAHCLLWVKDAPKIDQDPDDVVIDFIEKYITATLPTHDRAYEKDRKIMENPQKHTHSDYCRRNNTCRFGFPKPLNTETLISRPPPNDDTDATKNAKEILQKVKDFLTNTDVQDMSLEDILLQLQLSPETYNTALQNSHQGPDAILKQNSQDVFLNACNQDILYLWGGNIDLQLIINENATVMYVCNYMTKDEKAMGETLK